MILGSISWFRVVTDGLKWLAIALVTVKSSESLLKN